LNYTRLIQNAYYRTTTLYINAVLKLFAPRRSVTDNRLLFGVQKS